MSTSVPVREGDEGLVVLSMLEGNLPGYLNTNWTVSIHVLSNNEPCHGWGSLKMMERSTIFCVFLVTNPPELAPS